MTHGCGSRSARTAACSTTSSAILRYVVHLPPAMVSSPDGEIVDGVIPGELGRVVAVARAARTRGRMPTNTREDVFGRRVPGEVARRRPQEEVDLLLAGPGLEAIACLDRRVRRAHEGPRSCHGIAKSTRLSVRARHHDRRRSPGRKDPIEHEVHALARRDRAAGLGVVDAPERVGEGPGGVHDAPGGDLERLAGLPVARLRRR